MSQATNESWADASATWADDIVPADSTDTGAGEGAEQKTPGAGEGLLTQADPVEYDFSLPDGMAADPAMLEEFKGMALDMGLSPQDARKIMDLEVRNIQTQAQRFGVLQETWRNEISNDPVFGGQHLPATVRQARKALATFDEGGGLLKELQSNGYGNHPGIIRFLARIGKSMGEDTAHTVRGGYEQAEVPLRDRLWPD